MKNLLFLPALMLCFNIYAQKNITMCHSAGATEEFAALASVKEFRNEHKIPEKYNHVSAIGEDFTFEAADGSEAYGYIIEAEHPTNKYVFVFHEWWGLNDYVKKEAEKLYNDLGSVNVIAIDLYDKNVATTREEAQKYMQQVKTERAHAIINGAEKYAGEDAEIATIGWCFGGGWSLQAAIELGENAEACVMYYGMPEKELERLKKLECDVLGLFAAEDQWINEEVVKEFADKMEKTDQNLTYKIFEAGHAFANPSNPDYNSEATREAYDMTLKFLKEKLM